LFGATLSLPKIPNPILPVNTAYMDYKTQNIVYSDFRIVIEGIVVWRGGSPDEAYKVNSFLKSNGYNTILSGCTSSSPLKYNADGSIQIDLSPLLNK